MRVRQLLRGQTGTEFALVAPVLLLLLFAMIEFAMVIYNYSLVSYAANDAARWASVRGGTYTPPGATAPAPASATDILNHVVSSMPLMTTSQTAATCPPDTTTRALEVCSQWPLNNSPGNVVEVQVQYNFLLTVPFLKTVTLPLTATAEMVISQ